jgi:hypothetical protein
VICCRYWREVLGLFATSFGVLNLKERNCDMTITFKRKTLDRKWSRSYEVRLQNIAGFMVIQARNRVKVLRNADHLVRFFTSK